MRDGLPPVETPTLDALNDRQRKFVMVYSELGVGRDAYKAAGYKVASDEVADAAAARLLGDVKVCRALDEIRAATVARFVLSKEEALLEVLEEARDKQENSGSERLKAWSLIGDWNGWKPQEIKGPAPVIVQVNVDNRSITAIS